MTSDTAAASSHDWKSTLFLPKTEFPMRAGLPAREPGWLARWEEIGIYDRLREKGRAEGRPVFTLHDGPPYANGHLHIGHALNKVLKDLVVRSQQMLGHDSRYVPGWDCHGLPIEWKIEEQYRAKGLNKDEVPINELRGECRRFAADWVEIQREEFKRLGVGGDWANPYLTMNFDAEAVIAAEFMKFVMNGSLYRGSKPVMWSVVEKTALAEAEVEYHDHQSHTIWVKFPVVSYQQSNDLDISPAEGVLEASVVIWTTTPWTIPQNRAVAFNPLLSYGLYEVTAVPEDNWVKRGETLILCDDLAEEVFSKARVEGFRRLRDLPAKVVSGIWMAHPFRGIEGGAGEWDFEVPMLPGDHVTADAGTGFVHTAPSHGADDYVLGLKHNLEMTYNVLEDGSFRADMPLFAGKVIFTAKGKEGDANAAVIEKLGPKENGGVGALIARGRVKHSYPHSWRSKAPLIFRNTPQWFVAIDKPLDDGMGEHGDTIRARALKSINELVTFTPEMGRNRLRGMIESRPDWVLSRQRAWGVPLACFMKDAGGGEVELLRNAEVNARIEAAFRAEGADAWFADGAKDRFLTGIKGVDPDEWTLVGDILDVWFDSGSTHAFVLRDRDDGPPDGLADLYLEGTDQHRGWFHSSLLQGCGTKGRAPYQGLLTHGFTLDAKGLKMSKSIGNTIAPEQIVRQYGADILRLWVAQSDYTADQRIGDEILKGVADSYRRLRNTFRFLLGALDGFDTAERVAPEDMPMLERFMLHRLAELDQVVRDGYRAYEFRKVQQALFDFCSSDLSAFFFDARKDALYCDGADSLRRRATRTVMEALFDRLVTWYAPILPFTAEDAWLERFPGEASSVHLVDFPATPAEWRDDALAAAWVGARKVRSVVTGALEIERREKRIGASLEASPRVWLDPAAAGFAGYGLVERLGRAAFADLCITSGIEVVEGAGPEGAFRLGDVPGVAVEPVGAEGCKCGRCWKVLPEVTVDGALCG
ncbi:MAG: isoleucyl-tRNA synthetase, partial [Paracoccaceae bacterium]